MSFTISEIAAAIGAGAEGATDLTVTSAAEPGMARADQLAIAGTPDYAAALAEGGAKAALLWAGADWRALGLEAAILPKRPRFAIAGVTTLMDPGQHFAEGIHPSAVIDPTAEIGAHVHIGALCVIGPRARIGEGSVLAPQCFVGADAVLGPDVQMREQVSIGARAQIGARVILQPGVRIGGDGFSFVTPERSAVEEARQSLGDQGDAQAQSYTRIHSLGAVQLMDDVEVGANSTIDNGTIRDTVVGARTKIDNLVQVGHNVVIGTDTLLCAQCGVAGSSTIGNNVVLGGHTGVNDNIFVGDRVIAGGGTKILSNVPAGRVVLGYPATKMDTQLDIYKSLRRLPRLLRDVSALQKAVFKSGSND